MTDDDKKLETFTCDVIEVVRVKNPNFHSPDRFCLEGVCPWCVTNIRDGNWNALVRLAQWFWRYAPDVSDNWRDKAQHADFDPDGLHELMLGVFIGGAS